MRIASLTPLLLLSFFAQAEPLAENLQTIRYLAFSAGSHLLLHFNPNQIDNDPRYAERYHHDLKRIQQLVVMVGDPALEQLTDQLAREVAELESQPKSDAQLRPLWINPILQTQSTLDQIAQKRYMPLSPKGGSRLTIDRLSLDVQRLLLLYQTRTFGSLGVYIEELKEDAPETLDRRITEGFSELARTQSQSAGEIAKLSRMYEFVRPRLLKLELGAVPSGAAYYLAQIGDGLAQLSEQEVRDTQ
ncbi:hypothetical protein ACFW0H_02380 [Pseudomonas sp. CR3202]|uniref:hypothetical protein n=1 Tax=Pseudomonas sp. CR3202 TaxID=3351532 RepID=UPI003BF2C8D5